MNKKLNNYSIKMIFGDLEKKELKPSSHLYRRFPGMLIGDACKAFSMEYCKEAKERPGLVLLSVILSAHRNYTKQVEPHIDRIRKLNFKTFHDLKMKTINLSYFSQFCGMDDYKKYRIIVNLLNVIEELKNTMGITGDYEVMEQWAKKADYRDLENDSIGSIKGIGIATFQHLRMNFGADTVKPDQRVKEVLNKEFHFISKNDIDYIHAVEEISKVVEESALYVDQVFVNYGSGYYVSENEKEDTQKKFLKAEALTYSDISYESINKRKLKKSYIVDISTLEDITVDGISEPEDENNLIHNKNDNVSLIKDDSNNISQMIEYLTNSTKEMNLKFIKRADGAIIAELKNPITRVKNVFTYWETSISISVRVIGLIDPRKTYYSVQQMEHDELLNKIKAKYNEIAG